MRKRLGFLMFLGFIDKQHRAVGLSEDKIENVAQNNMQIKKYKIQLSAIKIGKKC